MFEKAQAASNRKGGLAAVLTTFNLGLKIINKPLLWPMPLWAT
ncbi:hypothetical protein RCH06_003034 [Polaromonas sp. CG_9.5]|nr:hypothetical protein [Polaromonas sp. CG_9.5]